ncbi:competence type IV pilus assembly protein ComGB [Enterococcus thailandicus]|uniref:competence type IV pilus assembly protein ComGB n=1 Tax=Enterococcus thailandicus TaxID=417368 RepID=UPI003A520DBF
MFRQKETTGGHIHLKKLNKKQQQQFIQIIADLLSNGFSLQEALQLVIKLKLFPVELLEQAQKIVISGGSFTEILAYCGFNKTYLVQVELAEVHGNLITTLESIADQFQRMGAFRKELQKLLSYPALLSLFLIGILFSMRQIVLPQLLISEMVPQNHWGIQLIQTFHWYVFGILVLLILLYGAIRFFDRKGNSLRRSQWLSQLKILGPVYTLYQSAYFSLELGKLFNEGLELKQVVFCLKETKTGSLMQQLALQMANELEKGISLATQLEKYSFLTEEFSTIVQQGELKGNLGKELLFYSNYTRQHFFERLNRWLSWIQPVLFLVIACLILMIYAAVLLPIYGNLEEVIS